MCCLLNNHIIKSQQQAPMGFMELGEEFHGGNASHWEDQKQPSFTSSNHLDNTNWESEFVCMSVAKEAIIKATGRANAPLETWGCTNSPRYHSYRFHTYSNCSNNLDPEVSERAKGVIQ